MFSNRYIIFNFGVRLLNAPELQLFCALVHIMFVMCWSSVKFFLTHFSLVCYTSVCFAGLRSTPKHSWSHDLPTHGLLGK
jgi:hypothetical protein